MFFTEIKFYSSKGNPPKVPCWKKPIWSDTLVECWGHVQSSGGIYLCKIANENTRRMCEICSKLTLKIPVMLFYCSLLLTWNVFSTLYWCFCCWIWTNKYWLGLYFFDIFVKSSFHLTELFKPECRIVKNISKDWRFWIYEGKKLKNGKTGSNINAESTFFDSFFPVDFDKLSLFQKVLSSQ